MKRVVMKAALLLALVLPVVARGQMTAETVVEDGRTRETLVTFAQEAPQSVRGLMDGYGLGDVRYVCGAASARAGRDGERLAACACAGG